MLKPFELNFLPWRLLLLNLLSLLIIEAFRFLSSWMKFDKLFAEGGIVLFSLLNLSNLLVLKIVIFHIISFKFWHSFIQKPLNSQTYTCFLSVSFLKIEIP